MHAPRTVGAKRVTQRLGCAYNGSTQETMHGQAADSKPAQSLAHAINVNKNDEQTWFVQGCVLGQAAQVRSD